MKDDQAVQTVHPTAVVDEGAIIGDGVSVGPYAVIGPGVEIGEGSSIGPHVVIERDTRLGAECRVSPGAVLGADPQDLKYMGERTWLEIGPRTVIRECATLNRGTARSGTTSIGSDCLIMAYAHIAHDCHIGDHVILSNATNMGGHVEIDDWAIIGGLTAIHQFVRVGRHAMVGGASRIPQDVAPYTIVAGSPAGVYGVNRIGLERRGFDESEIDTLRDAYRTLFRGGIPLRRAAAELEEDPSQHVQALARFVLESERGVISTTRTRRAASDGAGPDAA
ncbi:MAG: acyl-ACP--UDP-N-acetylglucosamine O-acyltransferase [Gemmatimonadota bacterium]|nr:acyl-ACP--UDP-N-acetylglucosamine O-acyltransferase [Gemmatimonadota bacterium]